MLFGYLECCRNASYPVAKLVGLLIRKTVHNSVVILTNIYLCAHAHIGNISLEENLWGQCVESGLNITQEVLKRGVGIAFRVYLSGLIGMTSAPLWSWATHPSHDLPRFGVLERQRQHTFRTRRNCLQAKKSTLLVSNGRAYRRPALACGVK